MPKNDLAQVGIQSVRPPMRGSYAHDAGFSTVRGHVFEVADRYGDLPQVSADGRRPPVQSCPAGRWPDDCRLCRDREAVQVPEEENLR